MSQGQSLGSPQHTQTPPIPHPHPPAMENKLVKSLLKCLKKSALNTLLSDIANVVNTLAKPTLP